MKKFMPQSRDSRIFAAILSILVGALLFFLLAPWVFGYIELSQQLDRVPIYENATSLRKEITLLDFSVGPHGFLTYETNASLEDITFFYQKEMHSRGWKELIDPDWKKPHDDYHEFAYVDANFTLHIHETETHTREVIIYLQAGAGSYHAGFYYLPPSLQQGELE